MQTINIWNQHHLYRKKITFLLFIIFVFFNSVVKAQNAPSINLPDSDDKWLHYGFVIGGHISNFKIRYSNDFVRPSLDTVQSIQALNKPGFSLGFLLNLRLAKYADIRLQPKVGFYEHELVYTYTGGHADRQQLIESTIVEFPLLIKYKSARRGNLRVYMIGGINPALRVSGKKDEDEEKLPIKNSNLSVEYGLGLDLYYPLFKFSPEIRFSHGLLNLLNPVNNQYSVGMQSVTAHSITLYLIFSD